MESNKDSALKLESLTDPPSTKESKPPEATRATTEGTVTTAEMAPSGRPRPIPNPPKREADLSSLLSVSDKVELTTLVAKITDMMEERIVRVFDSTGAGDENQSARPEFWTRLPRHLRDFSFGTTGKDGHKQIKVGTVTGQKEYEKPVRSVTNISGADHTKPGTATHQKENERPIQPRVDTPNGVKHTKLGTVINRKENEKPVQFIDDTPGGASKFDKPGPVTKTGCQVVSGPRLQELKKEALQHFKRWQFAVHKRIDEISVKKSRVSPGGHSLSAGDQHNVSRASLNGPGQKTKKRGAKPTGGTDSVFTKLYPPIATQLCLLSWEKRSLLLHSLLLLLLSLEHYSAYSRVLLLNFASALRLPLRILADDEVRVASGLSQLAKDIMADEKTQKRIEESRSLKKWKVDPASVCSGAATGTTGSLHPHLVAAGIGSILGGGIGLGPIVAGGLLGTIAENAVLVCALLGVYGTRATGKTMEQFVKDIQEFAFKPLRGSTGEGEIELGRIKPENRRLRVVLGIGGWLGPRCDIIDPWHVLGPQSEVYAVRWEQEALAKMGDAFETLVKSAAWCLAKKEIAARPIFEALDRGLWPVDLLKISKIIDNPWSVGMVRADKAGAILADMIMNKVQGERGVTLVGYSLGARVIYTCLMNLGERRALGLVENAVLMGTPAPSEARVWSTMKSVVSGRLVNVYSENDFLLGFLYRTSSIQFGVAGLQRVRGIDGVENVDVSDKVSGHMRYPYLVGSILKHIGWEDIDNTQVPKDEEALRLMEERHRERERRRNATVLSTVSNEREKGLHHNNQGVIQTRFRKLKGKKK